MNVLGHDPFIFVNFAFCLLYVNLLIIARIFIFYPCIFQEKAKREIIDASVEQRTMYEEDDCFHCGLCSFSSKSKKNMLRHSNIAHGVVINDKVNI